MSLINDALKKAQKQRTGEVPSLAAMPGIGGESAARIARSARPGGANALMLWTGAGAAVILLLVGGYLAFSPAAKRPDEPAKGPATAGTNLPAVAQQTVGQPPGSQPGTAVPPPVTFVLPIAQAPKAETARPTAIAQTSTPAPATSRTDEPSPGGRPGQAPGAQQPATASPESAPVPAKPAQAPKLEPRAITYIESIRVMGIRASATDSKVLMNDRVYRVGDTVEHEMGLKIVGITANSLTFEDERGGRFTRTF
jgi:hypothetical protein